MSSRNAQCAIAGVKGISDAVRGAINAWITNDLITLLLAEYKKTGGAIEQSFGVRVRNSNAWKRYKRGNDPNGDGFFRQYYCQEFGQKGLVDLKVLTNRDDTAVKYVMFLVNGHVVYGGACNVPSTYFSQLGYQPTIQNPVTPAGTGAFVPFTAAQIRKLAVEYEYGGMSAIDRMLEERI